MKRSVRLVLTLVLCPVLSLSGPCVGVLTARATEMGTWTRLALHEPNVNSLAISPFTPTTLFAGTVGSGVYRSTDSGTTWAAANTGLTTPWIVSIAINPAMPSTVYAGTYGGGVFRTADAGTTWTAASMHLSDPRVISIAINPLTPTTLYAGTVGGGVFRSIDSGTTWTAANTSLTTLDMRCLAIDPTSPATLYAGTDGGGIFRTANSGSTWVAVNMGLTNQTVYAIAINPTTTSVLYAGTDDGVFRSTDGGGHWAAMNAGLTDQSAVSIAINARIPTTLYAGIYGGGVFSSTDSGTTWSAMNAGLTDKNVQCVAVDSRARTTAYVSTDTGVFRYDASSSCTLTSSVSPAAGGSIDRSPDSSSYARGAVIHLAATPSVGYTFSGWSGDLTGTTNPATITMDADKIVTATFTRLPSYTLTPSTGTGGSVTPNMPQTIIQGGSKAFTIVPSVGYRVADVSVDGVSQGVIASYTFTNVTSNHTISARFEEENKQTVIVLQIGNSMFSVNGHSMGLDSPPVIRNGRTLVPIRAIIESLGGTVGWDGTARKATVALGSASIDLWIGKSAARVNGVTTPVDSANVKVVPEIINGRTMLPLRFVSENVGCSVDWVDATKTITITYQP
ncbi:MAG: stalk domain-containing protein [Caldiserica bacterium]|nr:stalk domain-containing protein [Caldisericota bacterium]